MQVYTVVMQTLPGERCGMLTGTACDMDKEIPQ